MTVKQLFLDGAVDSSVVVEQNSRITEIYQRFFLTARLCHDLKETEEHGTALFLGDPMEIALVEMAQGALPRLLASPRLDEISFDGDGMRLSTHLPHPGRF